MAANNNNSASAPAPMEPNAENVAETVRLLSASSTGDGKALETLQQIDKVPGFKLCLMSVFMELQHPRDLRLLAVIHFKNAISRSWHPERGLPQRPSQQQLEMLQAHEAERAEIRKALLLHFSAEPEDLVSAQLSLAMSTIARSDWPAHWRDLFPALLTALRGQLSEPQQQLFQQAGASLPAALVSRRALEALAEVSQAVLSKVYGAPKADFEHAAAQTLPELTAAWMGYMQVRARVRASGRAGVRASV